MKINRHRVGLEINLGSHPNAFWDKTTKISRKSSILNDYQPKQRLI